MESRDRGPAAHRWWRGWRPEPAPAAHRRQRRAPQHECIASASVERRRSFAIAGGSDTAIDRSGGAADAARESQDVAARVGAGSEGLVTFTLLLALSLWQGPGLEVITTVDPPRLKAGEQLTFTIRVRTQANATPAIEPLSLEGFTVLGSREVTEVSLSGADGSVRTFTRDLS